MIHYRNYHIKSFNMLEIIHIEYDLMILIKKLGGKNT